METLTQEEKEILKRALKCEEEGHETWEWWMVNTQPAKIMKLVNKGLIVIVGKKKTLLYKIADKNKVKELIL